MSIVEVKVPQLSESVAEATLLQWKKKPGESIAVDEVLIEVETDKVVLEVPAPSAGVLAEIVKGDGSTVTSGELIARIDSAGKVGAAAPAPAAATVPAPAAAAPAARTGGAKSDVAMPAAAKMMADAGLAASQVAGTGRDGRITKGDVIGALEAGAKAPAPVAAPATAPAVAVPAARPALPEVKAPIDLGALSNRPEQRVPMSRLRQRVAERLVQSQSTAAILTTFNEVNMQPVMDMRNRYKDKFEKEHGVKLGFMSFFVRAAVAALKKYPVVNASVAAIEKKIADFGKRAGEGKLGLEELTGGTFSISNGGVFGSMLSTPIINPPQSAILGVHATKERAVVENGQIVIRPMNYLALSYDHRIIDGREAVLSLVAMKEALEDPARLLLAV